MNWTRATICCLALLLPAVAHAEDDPRVVVQTFSERLKTVMEQARQLGFHGREEQLRPAIEDAYDVPRMARSALGPASSKLAPEEMNQLATAFDHYTVATYAAQFDDYDGEKFEVGQPRPSTEGAVVVPTHIIARNGHETAIDYLLRQDAGGNWRIVDVLLDGAVSQVAVRRSEFMSIYRRQGLTGLVSLLDGKAEAMGHP